MNLHRRSWLRRSAGLLAGVSALGGCATGGVPSRARVVVVGGGFGGATAAKYVRLFSDHRIDVVLVEPNARFISCPVSNLVLSGHRSLDELTVSYDGLQRLHGVRLVHDSVQRIDATAHKVVLATGAEIAYDKLIVSPGVQLDLDAIEGLRKGQETGQILQAWKAGPETLALRRQLEAMPDGGVFAITIPEAPYRCPPGPYERACVIASYFKSAKPRSKVLVLDANPDVTSKPALFKKVWADDYKGMVEYRPQHKAIAVDVARQVVRFEVQDDVRADVLNVLPPMRAGDIARQSGLSSVANRWAGVDYLSFESTVHRDVHVIGDAILAAPAMPKSAHMANSHAKVAAAAIVARLAGWEPDPHPMLTNTCYSHVDGHRVVHVASVHEYVAAEKTFKTVAGSGGLSAAPSVQEGGYAWNWARTIWQDALG